MLYGRGLVVGLMQCIRTFYDTRKAPRATSTEVIRSAYRAPHQKNHSYSNPEELLVPSPALWFCGVRLKGTYGPQMLAINEQAERLQLQ